MSFMGEEFFTTKNMFLRDCLKYLCSVIFTTVLKPVEKTLKDVKINKISISELQ